MEKSINLPTAPAAHAHSPHRLVLEMLWAAASDLQGAQEVHLCKLRDHDALRAPLGSYIGLSISYIYILLEMLEQQLLIARATIIYICSVKCSYYISTCVKCSVANCQ